MPSASDRNLNVTIRQAEASDLEAIIRLHEADSLGGHGDEWGPETRPAYEAAFAAIKASPSSEIYVVLDADRVVGTFQLTYGSTLTGRGRLRARLESVQVRSDRRSQGIGEQMVVFAEREARARGATTMELTSNKSRPDAHRFYERLGFGKTHEGFKKTL